MNAAHVLSDSMTMLRRQFIHMVRYPIVLFLVGIPVVFLLLFVYVFGETMGAGLGGLSGGRAEYLQYILPGILLMTVVSGAQLTPIAVAQDMTEGIMARFRTMSISRTAVLAGHVGSGVIQTVIGLLVTLGVSFLMGYRPHADAMGWSMTAVILLLATVAITWLSVACGLVTNSVEAASNIPMPLMLLPFFGSGFVPTESMPTALRWFAEYQPFTPMIETVRALLIGGVVTTSDALLSIGWCVAIGLFGYVASVKLYERKSVG